MPGLYHTSERGPIGGGSRLRDPDITSSGTRCVPAPPASAGHRLSSVLPFSCCVGEALAHAGHLLEKWFCGFVSHMDLDSNLSLGVPSVRHVGVSFPMCADPWSRLAERATLATSFLESGAQLSHLCCPSAAEAGSSFSRPHGPGLSRLPAHPPRPHPSEGLGAPKGRHLLGSHSEKDFVLHPGLDMSREPQVGCGQCFCRMAPPRTRPRCAGSPGCEEGQ